MTPPLPRGLYGIADTGFGDPLVTALQLARGGARVIQLRAKNWNTAQRVTVGRALVKCLHPLGVLVVMNDDLEAAASAGVDGLHLGQDDGSLAVARARLGPRSLLGRSTHCLAEAVGVEPEADYIGFGPVFETKTKRAAGDSLGPAALTRVVRAVALPVVAIGGIRLEHLPHLRAAGAHHWAVISDILTHQDPEGRARRFRW